MNLVVEDNGEPIFGDFKSLGQKNAMVLHFQRSDAGVGRVQGWESVFWGIPQCLKISKIQKNDHPEMQRFHADLK